jgi:hypothetical protein
MDTTKPQNTEENLNSETPRPVASGSTPPTVNPVESVNSPITDTPRYTSTSVSEPFSTPEPTPVVSQSTGEGKKPLGIMLGILLFLIIIFLGILFFFIFNKPTEEEAPVQQVPVQDLQPSPTSSITPTPELTEEGADSVDIGSPEASLSPIQNDIEQL